MTGAGESPSARGLDRRRLLGGLAAWSGAGLAGSVFAGGASARSLDRFAGLSVEDVRPRPDRPRPLDDGQGPVAPARLNARNAYIVDLVSGAVLFERGAQAAIPPASMTKLMTAFMAFEAIDAGRISVATPVRISRGAAGRGGSSMFLRAGERVRFEALVEGLVIASGNDAAAAIAETLAGSETRFAAAMTARAQALGLSSARFRNASGLPARGHVISPRDLAQLTRLIMTNHPRWMPMFSRRGLRRGNGWLRNRNPALGLDLRDVNAVADGMKTGHTNAAGYCVVATARQRAASGERRVCAVLAGLRSEAERAAETRRVLRWALQNGAA